MSSFPAKIHTYLRHAIRTRRGATADPGSVPRKIAKNYPRMEQLPLAEPQSQTTLKEALITRRSCRNTTGTYPSFSELSELFGLAFGDATHAEGHRHYPSGGSLYSIETYVITKLPDDAGVTVYHYQPIGNALERLWTMPAELNTVDLFRNTEDTIVPAGIILTARWNRTVAKYGDFGYELALLEAGHIAQNLMLAGTAAKLCLCPMGGFNDELVSEVLDLNQDDEQPVYTLTLSSPL